MPVRRGPCLSFPGEIEHKPVLATAPKAVAHESSARSGILQASLAWMHDGPHVVLEIRGEGNACSGPNIRYAASLRGYEQHRHLLTQVGDGLCKQMQVTLGT
jgi:hypothetical protein